MTRTAKSKPNLRAAQKENTRRRILEAARDLFYQQGYFGATVDQIVQATGAASRQTFYFHFKDKEEVLAELVDRYNAGGAAVMERLPGPQPTHAQLRSWLLELSAFLEEEKATWSVLGQLNAHVKTHDRYGAPTVELWVKALARRAPAFAAVSAKGNERIKGRAWLLIVNIHWAAVSAWERRGSEFADEVLMLATNSLYDFLHDPQFKRRSKRTPSR